MKKFILLLSLAFIAIIIGACSDKSSNSSNTSLKGQVLDSNYNPIVNVLIKTLPPSTTVLTDQNGNFDFDDIESGNYRVLADKANYYESDESVYVISGKTTNMIIILSSVYANNHPPTVPLLLNITDNQIVTTSSLNVIWDCSDPDNDPISYDIYFSKTNPPATKIVSAYKNQNYTLTGLTDSSDYYIQVIAKDFYNASSESSILHITTNFSSSVPVSNSMVAYFKFDGNATDASNNNLVADYTGCSYISGRKAGSQAASFAENSNSYIDIPSNNVFNFTNFTISLWIKPSSGYGLEAANNNDFFLVSRWGGTGSGTSAFMLSITTTGSILGCTYGTDQNSHLNFSSQKAAVNVWTHVAFVCDKGTLRLYINGNADNVVTGTVPQSSNYPLLIGKHIYNDALYNGLMDDLIIYNVALTANEIKALAQ